MTWGISKIITEPNLCEQISQDLLLPNRFYFVISGKMLVARNDRQMVVHCLNNLCAAEHAFFAPAWGLAFTQQEFNKVFDLFLNILG